MTRFTAQPLVSSDADARYDIARWARSDAITALIEAFGGEAPRGGELPRLLAWLDEFSSDHWDFRAGAERNLARTAEFAPSVAELVADAATSLGLAGISQPRREHYEHILILGGLVRACMLRPRRAAELIEGGLVADVVTALTAHRPLGGDESALAAAAGLSEVATEDDAMDAGLRLAFALGEPSAERRDDRVDLPFASSLVHEWGNRAQSVVLVVAPSGDPAQRRANTADTYRYWAEECALLRPGTTILLVTSAIYVPYQHADAVRMLGLPYGAELETIGVDPSEEGHGVLAQTFTTANYLQEIGSTIRAMRALEAEIDGE